jgi:hypothetical protein
MPTISTPQPAKKPTTAPRPPAARRQMHIQNAAVAISQTGADRTDFSCLNIAPYMGAS